jgi:hypothetical protein
MGAGPDRAFLQAVNARASGWVFVALCGLLLLGCGKPPAPPPDVTEAERVYAQAILDARKLLHAKEYMLWIPTMMRPHDARPSRGMLRDGLTVEREHLRRWEQLTPPATLANFHRAGVEVYQKKVALLETTAALAADSQGVLTDSPELAQARAEWLANHEAMRAAFRDPAWRRVRAALHALEQAAR